MFATGTISAIIVNFRTPDLTLRCVRSIIEQSVVKENAIIVVDNFSQDNSVEILKEKLPEGVRLLCAEGNSGYGAGVNVGFPHANAEYILVLNPDTYFELNSVDPVVRYMEANADVGLVGLDLVNPDGSRQYSARRFYSFLDVLARRVEWLHEFMKKRIDRHLMREAWVDEKPFDAEWVMGTGFIIRHQLYTALGGMDERYFLYMEDVDLCARSWCAGFKVQCYPGAQLVHDHQRSSAAGPLTFAGRRHIRSMLLFKQRFTLPLVRSPGIKMITKSFR